MSRSEHLSPQYHSAPVLPGAELLYSSDLLDQIIDRLRRAQAVQVVGHLRPDGDCIGALLGMHFILEHCGVRHALAAEKLPGRGYRELEGYDLLREGPDPALNPDLCVFVDCASLDRGLVNWPPTAPVINIDHHASNTRYGELNWIEPRCASATEMLFHFCRHAGIPLTPPLADALLIGLTTDTGSYRFSNTGPLQHRIAAELIEAGASVVKTNRLAYGSATPESLRFTGHVLHTLQLEDGGSLAWAEIRTTTYDACGGEEHLPENIADHLRSIHGVRVGVLFHEVAPDLLRANFRSDGSVNVSELAREFGGGGHPAAAGLTLKTEFYEKDRDRILQRVIAALQPAG